MHNDLQSGRLFREFHGCVSSMVVFKATVMLLNIHTTWLPWSSNKLSQNQLFTVNDFIKLALLPQLDNFKCKLLA